MIPAEHQAAKEAANRFMDKITSKMEEAERRTNNGQVQPIYVMGGTNVICCGGTHNHHNHNGNQAACACPSEGAA
jgi:hypothetical protein